jgi:CBS domain-containing protein
MNTLVINEHSANPELSSLLDFLKDCIPFDELPESELAALLTKIEITYYRKGTAFEYTDGGDGGLRIIRSGAAELRDKEDRLVDRLGETVSFNLMGLNAEQPGIKATLIEDSLIYLIPENYYQEIRKQNRIFDRFFHSQRSRRVRRAARHEPNPHEMMRLVKDFMSNSVLSISSTVTIQQAAEKMSDRRLSSVLIMDNQKLLGIVTDRDIRSRAVALGLDLNLPVSHIMTSNPETILPQATLFDATLFMTQHGYHHIPVMEEGDLKGIVTSSDLMLAKQDDPIYLVQHIGRQHDPHALKTVIQSLPNLMVQWINSGIRAHQVSHILTAISDAITVRLIELTIEEIGKPPVPFCWLGFGSQGRREQLLNADQDNGLLISNDLKEEDKAWFEVLAKRVCDGLNECGYIYCPGNVMAVNDKWRQPLSIWQSTVDRWTVSPTPNAVMHTSIFFDLRSIYGDKSLCDELQSHMLKQASSNSIFLAALAQNVLSSEPPMGIFRRFVVERNGDHADELDLKKRGILPIIDLVRIHSLANSITEVNTLDRLHALVKCKAMTIEDSRNMQDVLRVIMQLRTQHQATQITEGSEPNNYIDPSNLSKIRRKQIKDAFSIVMDAQQAVKVSYRQGMG